MSESIFDFDDDDIFGEVSDTATTEAAAKVIEVPPAQYSGEEPVKYVLDPKNAATFEAGTNYSEAAKAEAAIREQLHSYDERKAEINAAMDAIRAEMQAKLDALRAEITVIDEETYDLRRSLREATRRTEQMLRLFRQAIENEMALKAFKDNALKFDDITAGLHWREFAFDHQIDGGKYIAANKRVILGDKMGLGKSLTALIACDMMQAQKILIIVPDDVVSNFVHEVYKWAPHRQVITLGKMSKDMRAAGITMLNFMTSYIVVINYSAWRRDNALIESLINVRFDTVIMDEAHTIKETTTNAYKGCAKIVLADNSCPDCRGPVERVELTYTPDYPLWRQFYACKNKDTCGWSQNRDNEQGIKREYGAMRSVENCIPMTGTAILNKPTDLFALLSLVDPMNFREKYQFERDYCDKDYFTGKVIFRPGGMNSLVKKLSGKWLARDRQSAGVVLPKQEIIQHNLTLDPTLYPAQYKTIQQLTKYATIQLESGKQMSAIAAIALITRKRQANVWPGGIVQKDEKGDVVFAVSEDVRESIKLDWCIDVHGEGNIPDITADGNMSLGDRVVVFSQFKDPLKELETRLNNAGISVVRFDGDTPQSIRDQVKVDFDRSRCNEEGYEKKWQVVLCNYKTGGVGLNFTDATQMIVLDSEWNGGKADQAYARVDRMGQTEETTVHLVSIDNTIDTWMNELVQEKRDMVEGFESTADLAQALLEAMKKGDVL